MANTRSEQVGLADDVKDDPAMNVKVLEATDAYIQNSVKLTELTFHMKELTKTYRLSSTNLSNLVELPREANILGKTCFYPLKSVASAPYETCPSLTVTEAGSSDQMEQ
ncbi:hypothetical protein Tco_1563365 [Tanacetum coccineum]